MHKRNKHNGQYNFEELVKTHEALALFVAKNKYDTLSIDFFNPKAVIALNTALLKYHYRLDYWHIPANYLCPPIPGRAEYIHHAADLLGNELRGKIPRGKEVRILDIGTGANCIYPLIGEKSYGWVFVGTDIDETALKNSQEIIRKNKLKDSISLRLQSKPNHYFEGMIQKDEIFALSICNPPFHESAQEAAQHNVRKNKNLKGDAAAEQSLNFGGKSHELWCKGGEQKFIREMIKESESFKNNCIWFTTLVSKENNLKSIEKQLAASAATDFRLIPMELGNKKSRMVAWTYYETRLRKTFLESLG
jgi:23S rRNA (adenine1618-N6)-methyltransferase